MLVSIFECYKYVMKKDSNINISQTFIELRKAKITQIKMSTIENKILTFGDSSEGKILNFLESSKTKKKSINTSFCENIDRKEDLEGEVLTPFEKRSKYEIILDSIISNQECIKQLVDTISTSQKKFGAFIVEANSPGHGASMR